MKRVLNPKMLYFGTPVVLVSSLNGDGSTNVAPMSSAWWVGEDGDAGAQRQLADRPQPGAATAVRAEPRATRRWSTRSTSSPC